MLVLANAFSLNMLSGSPFNEYELLVREVPAEHFAEVFYEVREAHNDGQVKSIIGHQATADFLSQLIGIPVQMNRVNYTLKDTDRLIVFQVGTRLEEGKILTGEELKAVSLKIFTVELI